MIKLEKSEKLGRIIRRDDAPDLAIPTWNLVREAIRAGKGDEALKFLDYGYSEMKVMHDSMCSYVDDALTHLSGFGEEEIYKVIRKRYEPVIRNWIRDTPGAKESVERGLEFQKGTRGQEYRERRGGSICRNVRPLRQRGTDEKSEEFGDREKSL